MAGGGAGEEILSPAELLQPLAGKYAGWAQGDGAVRLELGAAA